MVTAGVSGCFHESASVFNQFLKFRDEVDLSVLMNFFFPSSSTGARFKEPAAHQYGTRWQHEPRVLPYGSRCPDHDRQQLRPIPQQVSLQRLGVVRGADEGNIHPPQYNLIPVSWPSEKLPFCFISSGKICPVWGTLCAWQVEFELWW